MHKRDLEVMRSYYYGLSRAEMIWEKELDFLDNNNLIRSFIEVYDEDFDETWYVIKDIKEKRYIVRNKFKNIYGKDIVKKFKSKYTIYKINTEVIKVYEKGKYPVVFKVDEDYGVNSYSFDKNINQSFLQNYYWSAKKDYKAVRDYRNKVEFEYFDNEEDAIYWCSNNFVSKEEILKDNTRPLDLYDYVVEYKT